MQKLKKIGFLEHHQRGSHLVLKHPDGRTVVLPMHGKDIPTGTLYAIVIHQAKLTIQVWKDI